MKTLWGRDFAVVLRRLAEAEVLAFFEDLMSQYREANQRLEHIDSIHELAKRTLARI